MPHVLAVAFLGPTIRVFFDGAVFGVVGAVVAWTSPLRSMVGDPAVAGV